MSSDRTDTIIDRGSAQNLLCTPSATEPIDAQALAELRSHFDEQGSVLFADLLGLFISELAPRLRAIRDAIGRDDAPAMAAAAHALKGSSMLVGARVMAELCLQIELAGRNGAVPEARVVMSLMEDEAARVREALQAALHKGSSR
jgi:HPt (histidine-containing phosphotransfer) domain-containing protein